MNRNSRQRRPARHAAFTLAEVLIAIGVLGVGLTMAASLFPAAMIETERSVNASIGTLICENALFAAAQRAKSATNINTQYMVRVNTISKADRAYPTPSTPEPTAPGTYPEWVDYSGSGDFNPATVTGYEVLVRRIGTTSRYELLIVAYGKLAPENHIELFMTTRTPVLDSTTFEWSVSIPADDEWVPFNISGVRPSSNSHPIQLGLNSPLLFVGAPMTPEKCQVTRVQKIDGDKIILDQEISTTNEMILYRFAEITPNGEAVLDRDPVMSVLKAEVTIP